MGFFKNWRERRKAKLIKRLAEEELRKIEATDTPPPHFHELLHNDGIVPAPIETVEMHEVTGSYKTVTAMMQEVIASKRRARESARRITSAIGAPPEIAKKK